MLFPRRDKLHPTGRWKIFYLSYLSKPASDRVIYKAIIGKKARRIMELGIAEGKRAMRMIDVAARCVPRSEIQYVGLDNFEDRNQNTGPGLSLISAHRSLIRSQAKIKLIPGDPLRSLARAANDLGQIDILIISPQAENDRLDRVWYFVPRLLHAKSLIFIESMMPGGNKSVQTACSCEVEQWAAKALRWKAA
jgi:hypothetical protein